MAPRSSESGPEPGAAETVSDRQTTERAILVAVALGAMLAPLNSTMIAVALPDLLRDFDRSLAWGSWIVASYLVAMAAVQTLGGSLGDRYGRRRLFLIGLMLFLASTMVAALSWSVEVLIAARTVQALAGAMAIPNGTALDSGPMEEIWSHGSDVSVMHPFGGRMLGWEEVRASWEQAAQAFSGGQVGLDEMVVVPIADDAAYTLGTEHGQGSVGDQTLRIDWRVTNIYRREAGGWKIVHHHTDFSSEVAEALGG